MSKKIKIIDLLNKKAKQMSEEVQKNGLVLMILGLLYVIGGCILWVKYPNNIAHMFFILWGGKFIGEGKENL